MNYLKFKFTRHARERCRERGIRFQDIKSALSNLDNYTPLGDGLVQTVCKIREQTIVVVFKSNRDIRTIVTAYYEN